MSEKKKQVDKILEYMAKHKSISSAEAVYELGCFRLASRICDLKNAGYNIRREFESRKNRDGDTVTFARYWLE